MAELTFRSPGVGVREIDLSSPTQASPTGVPAGVIGPANRGPAFVPKVVANYKEYINTFGTSDAKLFGPMAMYEWMRNAGSGLYVRVLGIGDGKKRTSSGINAGKVNNAGFVVGSEQVQSDGVVGSNPRAYSAGVGSGRTHFLGCFMSESNGSSLFSESGLQVNSGAVPILRAVIMTPSGVALSLSSSAPLINNNMPASAVPAAAYGFITGTVNLASSRQEFTMFLSGHVGSISYPNSVTASFDPASPNYFGLKFNTDPTRIEEAGHFLMSHWDIDPALAVVTGSGVTTPGSINAADACFVMVGAASHNSGTVTVPNYEGFENRFTTPSTPWIISQKFGGERMNLFKVHSLDDGSWANQKVKISIRNARPSSDPTTEYGSFDLVVRSFSDHDDNPVVLETFVDLNLDPSSQRYISKMIGDSRTYYDFDRNQDSQKLSMDGEFVNVSKYVRIEVAEDVASQEVPANSLPMGFRGYKYINIASGLLDSAGISALDAISQPPLPMRKTIAVGSGFGKSEKSSLHWGVQLEMNDDLAEPNKNMQKDMNAISYGKYFPDYHVDFANVLVEDGADDFCNNLFSLENVSVMTASSGYPSSRDWASAVYSRDGSLAAGLDRLITVSDLNDSSTRSRLKFTVTMQGGFDGLNIFDREKLSMSNTAVIREMEDSTNQFGSEGPTVAMYRKAIDVISEKSDVDIQVLAIPGIRNSGVSDYALDAVENRFDALYVMDIPQFDELSNEITGSAIPSVISTANEFFSRQLDSSFGAAYYPDVVLPDPVTNVEVVSPPSVAILGALSYNDKVAYPWFAPAGFTRGALDTVVEVQTKLNRDNLDTLYSSNINPNVSLASAASPVVYGQKTLLNRASSLDRVNVRRLLIEISRRVKNVADQIIFEPNREATLSKFSSLVDPILKQIQSQSGVDRYLVKIDATTTTQADVENNTIRGKIFLQPTKSIEFVSLDFVVSNAGATI